MTPPSSRLPPEARCQGISANRTHTKTSGNRARYSSDRPSMHSSCKASPTFLTPPYLPIQTPPEKKTPPTLPDLHALYLFLDESSFAVLLSHSLLRISLPSSHGPHTLETPPNSKSKVRTLSSASILEWERWVPVGVSEVGKGLPRGMGRMNRST